MKKYLSSISAINLIWIAALYFGIVLNLGFWRFIFEHTNINDCSTAVFVASLPVFLVLPLMILFGLLVLPYLTRPLLSVLLIISAAANYAMFKLGVFIDAEMYQNIVETNTREATDLLTWSFAAWFAVTAVVPLIWLWMVKIVYAKPLVELWRRLRLVLVGLIAVGVLAPFTYKEYVAFGRNNREVRKLVNTFNYIHSVNKYYKLQARSKRQFVVLDNQAMSLPQTSAQPKLLVLVVGETARAQNFSLYGYERQTNPELARQNVISFDTSSCGTATAVSLPCMFSHQERRNFKVNDARYTQNLVDLLQLAGNKVLWRENDDGCKGICDRVETEDMVQLGNPEFCNTDFCRDEALLDGLAAKIANLKQNTVIVLHTMGSHGPTYYKRYPDRFKKFTPACETADIQDCSQQQIINTYDNTLVYTDHVVASAIDMLKQHPEYQSSLIYVSDHGESLGENGIYLHGLPYRIAPEVQTKIPLVLWLSDTQKQIGNIDEACLRRNASTQKYSHDNLFHSVLGLMGTQTKVYKPELDIFAACRK